MNKYNEIIYNLYPRDLHPSDIAYVHTPEIKRQWELIEHQNQDNSYFIKMCEVLKKQLNFSDFQDYSLQGIFDLSRKAIFRLPENPFHIDYPFCVVSVSIVANLYSIYFTKFAGVAINTLGGKDLSRPQQLISDSIGRIISSYYPGYIKFPISEYASPVANILSDKIAHKYATYYDCLMGNHLF